jgi:hypothetical protein
LNQGNKVRMPVMEVIWMLKIGQEHEWPTYVCSYSRNWVHFTWKTFFRVQLFYRYMCSNVCVCTHTVHSTCLPGTNSSNYYTKIYISSNVIIYFFSMFKRYLVQNMCVQICFHFSHFRNRVTWVSYRYYTLHLSRCTIYCTWFTWMYTCSANSLYTFQQFPSCFYIAMCKCAIPCTVHTHGIDVGVDWFIYVDVGIWHGL